MPPIIELSGLTVRLGKREVLKELNIALSGRAIGLLGPNGAGKSTLIQTLLGFCPLSGGTAKILGQSVRGEISGIRDMVGYMPENDAFIANMSAVSFVRMMGELSGVPAATALERAHEVLFYVGLGEVRYRRVGTFSIGMKQLVKLAQAMVHGPRLLILDEPTNGLDPPARARMIQLIREMKQTGAMHLVVCSHLLRDVEETCDEVVILKQGRIVHHSQLNEEGASKRRYLEVQMAGGGNGMSEALGGLGCTCTEMGAGRYRLVVPEGFDVRGLYRVARARETQVTRMSYRSNTLQDVFLQAMEA